MYSELLTLLFIYVGGSVAEDVAICSTTNETQSRLTLEPYTDGIAGRYLAKLCTEAIPEVTSWTMTLMVYNSDYRCIHGPFNGIHVPGVTHSVYHDSFKIDGTCSQICLNTTFDLIYSGCYSIRSFFSVNEHIRNINYTYFNIKNNLTLQDFMNNTAQVEVLNHNEQNLTVIWHTGVPFDAYEMIACRLINTTNGVVEQERESCGRWAREACSARAAALACGGALPDGCYRLRLQLRAAWRHGLLRRQANVLHHYCKKTPAAPAVRAASGAWWAWAAGGALAAAAAGVAARAALRSRDARALHKAVLQQWRRNRSEMNAASANESQESKGGVQHILLLYAREGPAGAALVAALRAVLEAGGLQVHDLFSAESASAAAAAPAAWLRGLLRRRDVRVLLLQSPALALLYGCHLRAPADLQPEAPLLGRRVAYRAPQFGDALLQYALRLAVDAAHAHHDYRKYYVATVCGGGADVAEALVPYRRYPLPAAAALLARDLAAPAAPAVAALQAAARAFAEHVAEHPDYLVEHLTWL